MGFSAESQASRCCHKTQVQMSKHELARVNRRGSGGHGTDQEIRTVWWPTQPGFGCLGNLKHLGRLLTALAAEVRWKSGPSGPRHRAPQRCHSERRRVPVLGAFISTCEPERSMIFRLAKGQAQPKTCPARPSEARESNGDPAFCWRVPPVILSAAKSFACVRFRGVEGTHVNRHQQRREKGFSALTSARGSWQGFPHASAQGAFNREVLRLRNPIRERIAFLRSG